MIPSRFYNSLTKQVEDLMTKEAGKVRIYNCGPTVYKRPHLGNMRRFLFADFLRRTLEFLGYEVYDVTNITDVGHLTQDDLDAGEDKLEREARQQQLTPQEVARSVTEQYLADLDALAIERPHQSPRASEHIAQMQTMIARLLERGHAYQTPSGVYYDVQSFPDYGKLSGNTLAAVAAGARVAVREDKKHPADFALWKTDDPDHLQQWDSPWGQGYPGWHIECSAMSQHYLGSDIDIHTGGEDNKFPHHENEIAQSEGASDEPFVRLWMHNGFLQLDGEKLAKRAGEQVTLDTLAEMGYSPLAFRLLVFGAHYRSKVEFSPEALAGAAESLAAIKQVVRRLLERGPRKIPPEAGSRGTKRDKRDQYDDDVVGRFGEALGDDLNTPRALAVVSGYVKEVNTRLDAGDVSAAQRGQMWATLEKLDEVVGVIGRLREELEQEAVPAEVQELVAKREQARAAGDFTAADRLRERIEAAGYVVEDTDGGPRVIRT